MTATNLRQDQRMDQIMAVLLRSGVLLAASLVFIGGVVYISRHDSPAIDYRVFQGEPEELRTVGGILREAAKFHGRGLIQLGLLVLIATPVARVLFSVFAFLYERDWTYVAITMIVLALLCYSLFGGGGL
ncbi:MAG TPA: DUF1634 domain-containing protein [Candidatus Dormibacteraeota bacterium]|jgi:uncharacterized membrane protein|nr:DUF1634 domain-containing protein [Candidatus Dormibacteraeota bacterium]